MDFVTTVLQACDAEPYIDNFYKHKINDTITLKSLCEEDLEILIDDDEIRRKLNVYLSNLQVQAEKPIDRIINAQYTTLVVNEIAQQLRRHRAILTTASARDDIALCDIKLMPYLSCLKSALSSFEETLNIFEHKILQKKRTRNKIAKCSIIITNTVLITSVIMFCWIKYWR